MAVPKGKKDEILKDLTERFKRAKSIMFTEYKGLTVKQIGKLRNELRNSDADYKVAKKTLIELAAKEIGVTEIPAEALDGPISVSISYKDELSAAKILFNLAKEFKEGLTLRGGIMDGMAFGAKKANQLATIPSRQELLAKLVGSMKSPISGFHGVLHGVMRSFVGTVSAYADKKGSSPEVAA